MYFFLNSRPLWSAYLQLDVPNVLLDERSRRGGSAVIFGHLLQVLGDELVGELTLVDFGPVPGLEPGLAQPLLVVPLKVGFGRGVATRFKLHILLFAEKERRKWTIFF